MVLGELRLEKSPLIKLTRRRFPLVHLPVFINAFFIPCSLKIKWGKRFVLKTIHNKQIYVQSHQ